MTVSMGCNLNNISDNFENAIAFNTEDKFWNDVLFLKAFNALPYDQNNKVDENLLAILAKVMRIDEDIAMTYKSDNSSLSYMWGYMPIDANYKKLVFKNDSKTKTIPIYQAKQIGDTNNDINILDFNHMFYNEKFMDKSSRKSLAKIMNRKAWITDWNLLSDYDNAIVPAGEYKVYFEDENGKHVPIKNYDNAGLTDYQFKLNSGSEYDCFSKYVFHYDTIVKAMILNVRKIVA